MSQNQHCSDIAAPGYSSWRQLRLTERLGGSGPAAGLWNNLISVAVIANGAGDAGPMLEATLAPLLQQTFRNIEVLVVGEAVGNTTQVEDFASYRGLFLETPSLSHLDILRDSRFGPSLAWQPLMFVRAGTVFDTDTFALAECRAEARGTTADRPDLVLCDHDQSSRL